VQRRTRAGVPALPRPVRQDPGALAGVPLLWPPVAAGTVPVPAQAGVEKPRRARGLPLHRLRGARRHARGQPVRRTRRPALPLRRARHLGQGVRHRIREEAVRAAPQAGQVAPRTPPISRRRCVGHVARHGEPKWRAGAGGTAPLNCSCTCTCSTATEAALPGVGGVTRLDVAMAMAEAHAAGCVMPLFMFQ
jgi:hypothetical protein